jgi:hypothetical protein
VCGAYYGVLLYAELVGAEAGCRTPRARITKLGRSPTSGKLVFSFSFLFFFCCLFSFLKESFLKI